ncbi:MAG: ATP-binding cassette domain-containing protein, partial [Nocardioidaceae bacterium]
MSAEQSPHHPALEAHLVVRRPSHTLDVHLRAEPGDVLAVIGPNGAGKSTLLRALAGIVPIDEGAIRWQDRLWESPGRVRVPTQDRRVGAVFQDQLLFPHLSALANAAFGPRSRGASRAKAARSAQEWLDRLGVGELAQRRPAALSGGQQQRVAIA